MYFLYAPTQAPRISEKASQVLVFTKIAEHLADKLEESHIIKNEDRELYVYGLNQGMMIILNLCTTLIVGLVLHTTVSLLIFSSAYIPLRSYAGGYHAKTPLRCYVLSTIMLVVVSIIMKHYSFNLPITILILLLSSTIIIWLSPVEDKNKPLDKQEMKVYKKRSLIILFSEIIICCLLIISVKKYYIIITNAIMIETLMLAIGKIKNSKYEY